MQTYVLEFDRASCRQHATRRTNQLVDLQYHSIYHLQTAIRVLLSVRAPMATRITRLTMDPLKAKSQRVYWRCTRHLRKPGTSWYHTNDL